MFKIDLHTHSIASPDGGVNSAQYRKVLASLQLDCIAVTDHNRIDFAQELQRELGEQIIVGEEIMSSAGEIIGLFLKTTIPAGLPPHETIRHIKEQGGLVYIPHPFESVRKGLHPAVLDELADHIDIVEICNGRAFFQNRSQQAVVWARLNHKVGVASSDAHGLHGLGRTFTRVKELPNENNLMQLLKSAIPVAGRPTMRALLYPKFHRVRKKVRLS